MLGPEIVQETVPLGATDPLTPATVAVNVMI